MSPRAPAEVFSEELDPRVTWLEIEMKTVYYKREAIAKKGRGLVS